MKKATILLLLMILAGGCSLFQPGSRLKGFHKMLPLTEGNQVVFENLNGKLEVFGWKKESLEVLAAKTGKSTLLKQTEIKVGKTEKEVHIHPLYPRFEKDKVFIDMELRVPQKTALKIKIQNGDLVCNQVYGAIAAEIINGGIVIEDFSGTARMNAKNGKIVTRLYEPKEGDVLHLETVKGDIVLFLPAGASTKLSVETKEGTVHSEYLEAKKDAPPVKNWEYTLGSGAAEIHLHSTSGNIHIKKLY
ncbi:MAG: DUF4097 family beta strand repeat protein [Candidatus Aminicenantes bacterium]|nr:DUF4097 family beta strand repeat protein [Candidatus Aminicenantes bacterium]